MATIELPAEVPAVPHMDSQPTEAASVAGDFRTVGAVLHDVQSWSDRGAAPKAWKGDAAEAAGHARTRFARRADVAEEALQLATVASVRFEDRLQRLEKRRSCLDSRRSLVNEGIQGLRTVIDNRSIGEAEARTQAAALRRRASDLTGDITVWMLDLSDAEADYVGALQRIDTVAEARKVAAKVALPDTRALYAHLRSLRGDARATAAWWASLTVAQQQALMVAYPGAVGSTDGIPMVDRDAANRTNIDALRSDLQQRAEHGRLTRQQQRALTNLDAMHKIEQKYAATVDPETGQPLLDIIKYDPFAYGGDGSSIVSLGNPDLAGDVTTYTPGLTSHGGTLDGFAQVEALHTSMAASSGSAATILYDDYNMPDLDGLPGDVAGSPGRFDNDLRDAMAVASPADARDAAHHLVGFLHGLDATRTYSGDPQVTVIGHSYGSEVAAYAAQLHGSHGQLDNVVLVANPGVPGHDVHDLVGNSGIHVYVGSDDHDPVSLLGRGPAGGTGTLGQDPAAASYGATRFSVSGGPETLYGLTHNHDAGSYFSGEGLRNITAIATGHQPQVVAGRTEGSYENLPTFVRHSAEGSLPWPYNHLVTDGDVASGNTPAAHAVHTLTGLVPGPVKVEGGRLALDGAGGAVDLTDAQVHALDLLAHGAGPLDPLASYAAAGLDGVVPVADDVSHNVETLLSDLKGLL
ncbi:MAG: alpha/beta hydrolase [Nocardioidaceae bacterium]|nr:alpha/beta hydrolase [Nocardioidaceae bacterium]